MRLLIIAVVAVLVGCSASPTLEELEDEALVTGDWSAVEAREQLMQRKRKKNVIDCPSGFTSSCYESGPNVQCECIRPVP